MTQASAKAKAQGSIFVSFFLVPVPLLAFARHKLKTKYRSAENTNTRIFTTQEAFGGFFITKRSLLATVVFAESVTRISWQIFEKF